MANDGMYDIAPNVTGYGSPGASALFGMQQELMRRAQVENAQKLQAIQLARQQQQDDLARQEAEQRIAKAKSDMASNEEDRKAQAALRTTQAQDNAQKAVESVLSPGVVPDGTTASVAPSLGAMRAAFLFGKAPVPAAADGTPQVKVADAPGAGVLDTPDAPAVPDQTNEVYHGTDAQRTNEAHVAAARVVASPDWKGTGNPSTDEFLRAQAQQILMSGKDSTIPAGVIVPKTATESDQRRALDIKTRIDVPDPKNPVTPTDAAWMKHFYELHPDEATKQTDRQTNIHLTIDGANARQNTTLTNGAIKDQFDAVQKKIDTQKLGQAADLITTMGTPGGVNEVVAVPEFLSAMAGGVGHGLRMSQAELNMIQKARPGVESFGIKLNNLFGNYTALTAEQKGQMLALVRSVAARESKLRDIYMLAQTKINGAKTPEDARRYTTEMNKQEADVYDGLIDPAGSTTPKSKYAVTVHD